MRAGALKGALKRAVARTLAARHQRRSLAEARGALTALERSRGPLAPALQRQAREYAGDVLGDRRHAPWLEVYAAVQGRFVAGWLPDSYYHAAIRDRVNGSYHHIARNRCTNTVLFGSGPFPDLLFVLNGRLLAPDHTPLSPEQARHRLQEAGPRVVLKSDQTGFGKGVEVLETGALDPADLARRGNGLVQRFVRPAEGFDAFGVPALPTLRVATAIAADGAVSVRACYLKIGRGGHSHVLASDQLRIAVDPATGALSEEGFLADWTAVRAHPDTGAAFGGRVLPGFAACLDMARDLHGRMPLARFLCWDVVPEEGGGVAVLEWEGGVVSFAEATQGPCFTGLGWEGLSHV